MSRLAGKKVKNTLHTMYKKRVGMERRGEERRNKERINVIYRERVHISARLRGE